MLLFSLISGISGSKRLTFSDNCQVGEQVFHSLFIFSMCTFNHYELIICMNKLNAFKELIHPCSVSRVRGESTDRDN